MLNILKAFIFGIVEGISEWLPISSTGHLILLNNFIKLDVSDNFYSLFEVVIQLAAVLAILLIFFKRLWPFGKKNNNRPLNNSKLGSYINVNKFILWFHILLSCIPAAIIGILFDDVFEKLFYNPISVALALIIVGIIFIFIEIFNKNKAYPKDKVSKITYKDAFIIGLFQVIAAIFPGTSRSGATIIGSLTLGINRSTACQYSFFLAIPVMFGASLLKIIKAPTLLFSINEYLVLIVGCLTSFIVSLLIVKSLLNFVKKHDFKIFGYYRIILGIIIITLSILKLL